MQATRTAFKNWALVLGIVPALFFQICMGLGPSFATFILSFTDISGVKGVPWKFIGLENYRELFLLQNPRDFIQVIKNTIIFCIAVTLIQNLIALFIALALNSKLIKGRSFFRSVVFMPSVLGVLVTSLVWLCVLNPMDGPVSKFIGLFGLSSGFFTSSTSALACCIFTQIWMAMGHSMVINLAGLQSIPNELYEVGVIDGTTGSQSFRYITLPLLWPTINVNIMLAIIGSLQSFQVILLTTGGRNMATQTLAARVMYFAFNINAGSGASAMRQGFASAWAMFLFVFILTATLIYVRAVKRRDELV
jgi:raffinose/stachyose/melibiose transport system permease protein